MPIFLQKNLNKTTFNLDNLGRILIDDQEMLVAINGADATLDKNSNNANGDELCYHANNHCVNDDCPNSSCDISCSNSTCT
jgi:hypothetical protein